MEVIDVFFFFAATSKLGGRRFCQRAFFFLPLLTLAYSSHHLPHVALADNRLRRRGEESDKRESEREKKRKQTQGGNKKGKRHREKQ